MKQTRIQLFGSLALAALMLSSCASLDKMKEAAKGIKYQVDPEILEVKPVTANGETKNLVKMSLKANVPAKTWDKKVSAVVTPVLVYEGGETAYPSVNVYGEAVPGNGQIISYANGGQFQYAEQSVEFNDKMRVSDLIVRVKFQKGDETLEVSTVELEMGPKGDGAVAKGVIATSLLLAEEKPVAVIGKDAFQRVINEDQAAELIYLINRADIRNGELKKDDVKAINDYIAAVKAAENKNLKDVVVSAYASPDGALSLNEKLSLNREKSAQQYIAKQLKNQKVEANIVAKNTPEDWEGFKAAMEKSQIADKELILRILSMYTDNDVREKEIKNLSTVFKAIADEILPALRRSTITVNAEVVGKSDEEIKELAMNDPKQLNVEELLYAAKLFAGDKVKEVKCYVAAATQFPNDWRTLNNKGVTEFENGNLTAAKLAFTAAEAIKADPVVENNLGVVALANKDYAKAKEYFGKAAGVGSELDQNLGVCALMEGDYAQAETYFGANISCNAALVKLLVGKYDAALANLNANTLETSFKYYLKALCGVKKGESDLMYENLRKACNMDSKWKAYAKSDAEFTKFFNDATFKSIVE